MAESYFLAVPVEVLVLVIRSLIDDPMANRWTGYPYGYYSQGYRTAQEETRSTLLNLCRTCRKLNAVVTPFLYGHVTLKRLACYPEHLVMPQPKTQSRLRVTRPSSRPAPARGIATLGLFLRTLVEWPALRSQVRHLECRFFLLDAVEGMADSSGATDTPKDIVIARARWELESLRQACRSPKTTQDIAVFEHVGLSKGTTLPEEVHERALAAILLLTTDLQSVALAPTPGRNYCPLPWRHNSHYMSEIRFRSGYSGRYCTLNSLLEQAFDDHRLSTTTLRSLEAVQLVFLVDHHLQFNGLYHARMVRDRSLPHYAQYLFRIDACSALLKAPKVVEFRADSVEALRPSEHAQAQQDWIQVFSPNLRRLFITSAANHSGILWDAFGKCSLDTLAIGTAEYETRFEDDSDSDSGSGSGHSPDLAVWDTALRRQADTLKILDIGSDKTNWTPPQHLSCLPDLVALEHLRIGLPLLNTNDGFTMRPLEQVLPVRLKTLTINDKYASFNCNSESLDAEESSGGGDGEHQPKQRPMRPHMQLLSRALGQFAHICGQTHPQLRSVMVFGCRPEEWTPSRAIQGMELAGPKQGQVVVDGGSVKERFARSGVAFRELFHLQEAVYPFSAVLGTSMLQ